MAEMGTVQGALQSLQEMYQQRYNPEESQRQMEARNRAVDQYQTLVDNPIERPGYLDQLSTQYLGTYDPRAASTSIINAIGRTNALMDKQRIDDRESRMKEQLGVANLRQGLLKEEDAVLKGQTSMFGRAALKGASPEQLRTVYTSARNEAAQIAKNYEFSSATEREQFIEDHAKRAVQTYLDNFAAPSTMARGTGAATSTTTSAATAATVEPGVGSGVLPTTTPTANAFRNVELLRQEMKRPEVLQDPAKLAVLRQELARELGVLQGAPQSTAQPVPQPAAASDTRINPPRRNIPNEKLMEKGNQEMASAYVKDYEAIQQAASSAADQKTAFDTLARIKPETNVFANTQQTLGSLFSALGQDPESPIIKKAVATRDANLIISQLNNASLKAEKGVQTKSDEVRIANEFPKTTDMQQVWNFSVKLGQERAQRMLDRRDYFDQIANANNGVPIKARQSWDNEMRNDPITQYYGGKLIFRSDYIRGYLNANPDATQSDAISAWRQKELAYQQRGGRK